MWDLLITAGNIAFLPGMLPLLISRETHIPRLTSAINIVALITVIAGLIGAGFVLSPAIATLTTVGWVFIFFFRSQRRTDG